jgi:hypothetical protein
VNARLLALAVVLLGGAAFADDDDEDEATLKERGRNLYGSTTVRVAGLVTYQAGTNPSHQGAGAFSRFGFGASFEGGFLGLFTSLGTMQGIEFRVALGYSLAERYVEPPETPRSGGLLLRGEARWIFAPRFLRSNAWRVMALTGIGLEVDGARWSDTWRAFATLGLRLQLFLSKESSVALGWSWMPGTANGSLLLRNHQAELLLAFGNVHLGARGQLELVGSAAGPGLTWQLGVLGGYAF